MAITYRGERFTGYNKPKRTSGHKTKSHAVLAKEGDKIKLIDLDNRGQITSHLERMNQRQIKQSEQRLKQDTLRT